jgi:hypothetical protein
MQLQNGCFLKIKKMGGGIQTALNNIQIWKFCLMNKNPFHNLHRKLSSPRCSLKI